MKVECCVLVWACALAARVAEAFVPALAGRAGIMSAAGRQASMSPAAAGRRNAFSHTSYGLPAQTPSSRWLSGRPSSGASTTTMGLFGLGAPEIAVCIAVAALILGPDKMAGFAKDMGKMAGELKDVPKEFQAGVQEGEAKTQKTIREIESNGLAVDAEPATKKEEEA